MEQELSNKNTKSANTFTDTSTREDFCLVDLRQELPLMRKVGTRSFLNLFHSILESVLNRQALKKYSNLFQE